MSAATATGAPGPGPIPLTDDAIGQALDQAIAVAAAEQPRLMAARAEWDRIAGVVHHDEPLFEERAPAFLEWFLVDYHHDEPDGSAIARQLTTASGEVREALLAIAASHRSVFQVRELDAGGVLLDDLWGGGLFRVHERERLAGIAPGVIFDARLVAVPPGSGAGREETRFGRAFCFHPREARAAIQHTIESARAVGERRLELLSRLLRLRVRWERYKHLAPAKVYQGGEPASPARP